MSKGRYECSECGEDFHDCCVNLNCVAGYLNTINTCLSKEELDEVLQDYDDPLERTRTRNYELGRVAALEDIAKKMFDQSGVFFAGRRDSEAGTLRKIAMVIEDDAKKARSQYDKKYHIKK